MLDCVEYNLNKNYGDFFARKQKERDRESEKQSPILKGQVALTQINIETVKVMHLCYYIKLDALNHTTQKAINK